MSSRIMPLLLAGQLCAAALAATPLRPAYDLQGPGLSVAHGGVGFTRLFGSDEGMFAEGNSIKPLLEAGASVIMPFNSAVALDARLQTHRFATQSMRDEDAEEGSVFRVVLSGSYTLGRSTR